MQVPLLDVRKQNDPLMPELRQAFECVMLSGRFILGPEVEKLEQTCAQIAGVRHGIGVSSGTDAILLALMALGIHPGDEVICPSFTFFATAGCVARVGALRYLPTRIHRTSTLTSTMQGGESPLAPRPSLRFIYSVK